MRKTAFIYPLRHDMNQNTPDFNPKGVYKLVNKRLGYVFLFIVCSVGIGTYYLEQYRLLNEVEEILIDRADQLSRKFGNLLADPTQVDNGQLQRRINEVGRNKTIYTEGYIVRAVVLDKRDKIAAQYRYDKIHLPSEIDSLVQQRVIESRGLPGEKSIQRIEARDQWYILMRLPLHYAKGTAIVLFQVSEQRLKNIHSRIRRSTLAALGIVVLTALALYPVIIRLTKQLSVLSLDLVKANIQTAYTLGNAIAKRDSDTDAHNYRVTIYSVRLAEAVRLDTRNMRGLIKGAFLHDVGKIGTPDRILLKPGELDHNEFAEMRRHVGYGVEIINGSSWLQDGKDVVLHHHEWFDGSGYSVNDLRLAGQAIPLTARIFSIADVFDALTSRRPYKEPIDFDATLAEMDRHVGTHFDPELYRIFKNIARPLYDTLANRDDELPKQILQDITRQYFLQDLEQLLSSFD